MILTAGCTALSSGKQSDDVPDGGSNGAEGGLGDADDSGQSALDGGEDAGDADDSGLSGAPGDAAVFELGSACTQNAQLGCAGFDSALTLICDDGRWSARAEVCRVAERCDTRRGTTQGQCLGVAPECSELRPGDGVCRDGERMRCGPDRITLETKPCPDGTECLVEGDEVTCFEHEPCPTGYVGPGGSDCAPTLTGLDAAGGEIVPALSPLETAYRAHVPITMQTLTLTPTAIEGATVSIQGMTVEPGGQWESPVLALGESEFEIVVRLRDHPDRVYTLVVERGRQEAQLPHADLAVTNGYGSVAISGDTIVLSSTADASNATGVDGDPDDDSAPNSGAAYVFVRDGDQWVQQAYLKASNTEAGDAFSSSLAISGDTIVIGASGEDGSATGVDGNENDDSAVNSGAAYVFVRSGSTWSQQAYLKASNTDAEDGFGSGLAISGDTIFVGAANEDSAATSVNGVQPDNSATSSGAAYVFVRTGAVWSQQAYLKASNSQANDRFGQDGAISGDTIVIGALGEDSGATGINGDHSDNSASSSGAAFVFVRDGNAWSQQAYLKASNAQAQDAFSTFVAISGDTIVVGASRERSAATGIEGDQSDNSASDSGAAYVFVRSGSTWSQQAYLKASNTHAGSSFGASVAISNDTLVVGAPGESSGATGLGGDQTDRSAARSGAGYAFTRRAGLWSQVAYLKADDAQMDDGFGWFTAISGDSIAINPSEGSSVYVFR